MYHKVKSVFFILYLLCSVSTLTLEKNKEWKVSQRIEQIIGQIKSHHQDYMKLEKDLNKSLKASDSYKVTLAATLQIKQNYLDKIKNETNLLKVLLEEENLLTNENEENLKLLSQHNILEKHSKHLEKEKNPDLGISHLDITNEEYLNQMKEAQIVHQIYEAKKQETKSFIQTKKKTLKLQNKAIDSKKLPKIIQQVVTLGMNSITRSIPYEFCWKQGGDAGVIPTDCPEGMFRSLALCYEYCKEGYTYVAGVCWGNCGDATDIGALCVGGGIWAKHTYMAGSLTNFSDQIPCPGDMYKGGALCYRNCKGIGMENCGIGACTRDATSCTSAIIGIVVDVIMGLFDLVTTIMSFGATTAIAPLKNKLKGLGKNAIKSSLKSIGNYVKTVGKDFMTNKVKDFAKEHIKEYVIDQVKEVVSDAIISKIVEYVMTQHVTRDMSIFDADYFVNNLTPFNIGGAVNGCKTADKSSNDAIKCANGVLTSISSIDPTGLTSIAAAFMQPVCDVPATWSDEQRNQAQELQDAIKAEAERKKSAEAEARVRVPGSTLRIFLECNYGGNYKDINLLANSGIKTMMINSPSGVASKFRSAILGEGMSAGFVNSKKQEEFIVLNPGQKLPCLNDYGNDKLDSMDYIQVAVATCGYFYSEPNFMGTLEKVCSSRDLKVVENPKSFKRLNVNLSRFTFFEETEGNGNSVDITDVEIPDLSVLGLNSIKSYKNKILPRPQCIAVASECNYEGINMMVCEGITSAGYMKDKLKSVSIGSDLKAVIMAESDDPKSRFLLFKPNDRIDCIEDQFPGFGGKLNRYIVHAQRCVILYSETDFTGDTLLVCENKDVSSFETKSIKMVFEGTGNEYKIELQALPNNLGGDTLQLETSLSNIDSNVLSKVSFVMITKVTDDRIRE